MSEAWMKGLFLLVVVGVAVILLLPGTLGGFGGLLNPVGEQTEGAQTSATDAPQAAAPTGDMVAKRQPKEGNLRDKNSVYEYGNDLTVKTLYLTVSRGNAAENTDHSWKDINTYSVYDYERMGVPRYQVAALVQEGDENGPLPGKLGYGEQAPNAVVQIRGQTSSKYIQKNYKIKLKDGKGAWYDQQTIALNKHEQDGMRFRNKLCYDLISEIDQMMGLRTQFVHLYVKDLTDGETDEFVDYGLYTQVEQLNKKALRAHGLSKFGKLYKINFFEFYRYEDIVRMTSDPDFDEDAMEAMIENKTGSDNADLIEMLEAVNNREVSVDELLSTYFDEENIAYWMAFQILTGNVDTQNRNMYIYSPNASKKWYIYAWDHDDSFMYHENEIINFVGFGEWETGISNYWGNSLFRRLLKTERFCNALDAAVEDLRAHVLTPENIAQKAAAYSAIVKPYVYAMPDIEHAPLSAEKYDMVCQRLPEEIEQSYQLYRESFKKPMPFYINAPERQGERLNLVWDPAYDFNAETIRYTVQVSDNYDFRTILMEKDGLLLPEASMEMLPPGQYFLRVTATNESGYTQTAFDYYVTEKGKFHGVVCFYVMPDGSVVRDGYVEG